MPKQNTAPISIQAAIDAGCFTGIEAARLRYLLDHLPMKRKDAEADSTVPYLPSFAQKVNDRLAIICGKTINSYPACDGTRRKVYYFAEVQA
jgi:hypothetical protein